MIDKSSIIKKSSDLYSKYGIKSISVDDVAFTLGISKKTLYEHIENRDELIQDVVENNLSLFYTNLEKEINPDDDVFVKLCRFHLLIIKQVGRMNPSYVFDLKKYHQSLYRNIIRFRDEALFKIFSSFNEQGIHEGIFRNDTDPRYLFFNQIHKTSLMIYDSVIENEEPISAREVYRLILNDIRGITTLKGHEIFDIRYDELLCMWDEKTEKAF